MSTESATALRWLVRSEQGKVTISPRSTRFTPVEVTVAAADTLPDQFFDAGHLVGRQEIRTDPNLRRGVDPVSAPVR
jgi:hypothetical protein